MYDIICWFLCRYTLSSWGNLALLLTGWVCFMHGYCILSNVFSAYVYRIVCFKKFLVYWWSKIDYFSNVKPTSHIWNKSHLVYCFSYYSQCHFFCCSHYVHHSMNPGQERRELRGWKKITQGRAIGTADTFIFSWLAQQP